ncbi:ABC transporter permease [Paenibacillus harenae]|uniref:ABC transporter permease n=1 Tax=Paenibacillus harenae TaxID=306543 RepID=UPI00278DDD16|nr:ABC transporter permease [Paenibacillus harenae]MDQ0059768.1 ABC-type transport system involved in multi-copper enzyme maturation permease subunit [Paenibacillus harenae]
MREQTAGKSGLSWRAKLINPVLNKEFRLRMRTPRSMWTLFFYLFAIGLMALSAIYLTQVISGSGRAFDPETSKVLFIFLSFAQLGLIAFMGPGLTAGVVSGEREKQTLNLLLTTQQSSTTIILSKLASSLSFMVLIVISTIPVYSMVFLYGGISPRQLLLVFLFYIFMMLVLGSFGIMFSTLFKRTMISVIVTYGITLFMFAGTALLFFVMVGVMQELSPNATNSWIGHILAWNPAAALYSILDPEVSQQVYNYRSMGGSAPKKPLLTLWQEFIVIYSVLSALALWTAIRKLRPRLKR